VTNTNYSKRKLGKPFLVNITPKETLEKIQLQGLTIKHF
jgi:hypothetical protein